MERFTRLRKVGSGSFGEVYQGLDNETGEAVAIKASRLPPGDPLILTLTLTCAAGVFLKMKVAEVLHTWHLCTLPQGKCCLLALTRWNSFHPLLPSGV
jgi:serine/threonine protein kinase